MENKLLIWLLEKEFCGRCLSGVAEEPVCIGTNLTDERILGLWVLSLPQTTRDLVFHDSVLQIFST